MTEGDLAPFLKLYGMEKQARDMYKEYASKPSDEELKLLFLEIMRQEENHMLIAKKILNILG